MFGESSYPNLLLIGVIFIKLEFSVFIRDEAMVVLKIGEPN